jgi:hypothetical protein
VGRDAGCLAERVSEMAGTERDGLIAASVSSLRRFSSMKCTARASLCGESFALAREGDAGTIV